MEIPNYNCLKICADYYGESCNFVQCWCLSVYTLYYCYLLTKVPWNRDAVNINVICESLACIVGPRF